jgi:hypothetical protein
LFVLLSLRVRVRVRVRVALRVAVEELVQDSGFELQYPHPDGMRVGKLSDAKAWKDLLDLAADPQWDLDG